MRPNRDQWAMELAQVTARRATCVRRAVGCVLLNERGHVLATGYNGVASGLPHCNEQTGTKSGYQFSHSMMPDDIPIYGNACSGAHSPSGTNLDCCQAIHAEQNALLQCRDVYEIHSAYVTTSPCVTCTKLLLNTGCSKIIFLEEYPQPDAKKLWVGAGRIWSQMPTS